MTKLAAIIAVISALCVAWTFAAKPAINAGGADFASRCVDADKFEGRPLVEIDFDNAQSFPEYEELDMDGHFKPLGEFQIVRETNQVRLIMPFDGEVPLLSGGELFGSYKLREARFAWGKKTNLPSRHVLAGERFPLEMHLIHQKVPLNKYSIRDTHEPMTDLAVVAVLFEESPKSSPSFSNLVNMILGSKNSSEGAQLTLGKLFPQDQDVFFRYEELMTDPSCQAHVSWTVFPTPTRLPMKEFRRLQTLYKGNAEEKSVPDKEYTLDVDVRLMSPPREAQPQGSLAPPDMHHRPAYGLIPPPQQHAYSDAVDHRGISIYHVFHGVQAFSDGQTADLAQPEAAVIPPQAGQGSKQQLNHESKSSLLLEDNYKKAEYGSGQKDDEDDVENGSNDSKADEGDNAKDSNKAKEKPSAETSALVSGSAAVSSPALLFSAGFSFLAMFFALGSPILRIP